MTRTFTSSISGSRLIGVFAALCVVIGCSDEPAGPPRVADVAGTYSATELSLTEDGVTTEYLDQGATMTVKLSANGTTSGRMFIPGGAEDGVSDLDFDLAGEWALNGTTVTFSQDADSFMRDVPFEYLSSKLVAQETFDGVVLRCVLKRAP